jgi:hypothetical protein
MSGVERDTPTRADTATSALVKLDRHTAATYQPFIFFARGDARNRWVLAGSEVGRGTGSPTLPALGLGSSDVIHHFLAGSSIARHACDCPLGARPTVSKSQRSRDMMDSELPAADDEPLAFTALIPRGSWLHDPRHWALLWCPDGRRRVHLG